MQLGKRVPLHRRKRKKETVIDQHIQHDAICYQWSLAW